MGKMGRQSYFQYAPGDQINDLTFDPPLSGVVVRKHDAKPDAYYVRIDRGANDVVIHARNLRKR